MTRFDVLVLGGGTAGCVLAARLSEEPSRRVCLVEAGPDYGPYEAGGWPAGHPRRALARLLAQLGDRSRGPLAAAGAHPRRLLGPQRVRPAGGHARRLRRVGRRLAIRRVAAVLRSRQGDVPRTRAASPKSCRRGIARSPRPAGTTRSSIRSTRSATVRWNAAFAYVDPARDRPNLTILGRHARRPRPARGRSRGRGALTSAGELRADDRRRRGRRVRLTRDPAPERHRARARPPGRRRAARPRRRRRGLGDDRPGARRDAALRGRRRRARDGAGDGAAHERGAGDGIWNGFYFPAVERTDGGYELSAARLRDEAAVARPRAPQRARPADAARRSSTGSSRTSTTRPSSSKGSSGCARSSTTRRCGPTPARRCGRAPA